MTDTESLTSSLREARSLSLAGGKGVNLGELLRAGFDVPDGFVVTTAAYDRFVADNRLADRIEAFAERRDSSGIIELFVEGVVAPDLTAAITEAYAGLGSGPVAVRSSATAEDLPDASFAGQQETLLNVSGAKAVLAAVQRCWASLWTERAIVYRATRAELDGRLSLAVVVQQLVPAEVSGVLFTANPGNGRRDESVITSAWGLGESVVGGTVDTDTYVVRQDGRVEVKIGSKVVMTVPAAEGSIEVETPAKRRMQQTLTEAQARGLAEIGRAAAAHFGVPQDIEWVWHDGRFRLVQARPITALPEPVGDVPTEWPTPRRGSLYFRASIVEQMPDPLTPLFADMVRAAVPDGLDALFDDLGLGPFDVDFPTINGYAFYDYGGRAFVRMMLLAPRLMALLFVKGFVVQRWGDRELPRYQATVRGWSDRDPAELTASELLSAVQELLGAGCRYYTAVQMVIPLASTSELLWTTLYDQVLRRAGDPEATDLLLGFDSTPIRAEKSLFELARWCLEDAALVGALRSPEVDALAETPPNGVAGQRWADWRARFEAHLAAYGHTTYNLDWVNPVPADDPAPMLAALRHALGGTAPDPAARQARLADRRVRLAEELFHRLDPLRGGLARRALQFAQTWAPIREDALAAMGLAWPVMRRLLHELGRRLAESGALEDLADVFWLRRDEAHRLAAMIDAGKQPETVGGGSLAERRMSWRGQALATPPQYLPESRLMRSMKGMLPAREQAEGSVLTGASGSGGSVRAVARVLSGPADFVSFQPGEVLVASITTPAYTPLFAMAAAVVTDIGGVLSHGSIVAREYGIPAVLGTGVATKRIRTGDVLTVDGTRGQVLLPGAEPQGLVEASPVEKRSAKVVSAVVGAGIVGTLLWSVAAIRRRRRPNVRTRGELQPARGRSWR